MIVSLTRRRRHGALLLAVVSIFLTWASQTHANAADVDANPMGSRHVTKLSLPGIFSDNMVLQQNRATVWGTGEPWAVVTVAIGPVTATAKADASGTWRTDLKNLKAPGPYAMVVTDGSSTLSFKNVAVGQVWLIAGSSRVDMPFSTIAPTNAATPTATHGDIRFFAISPLSAYQPATTTSSAWQTDPSPASGKVSALAVLFARSLATRVGVPIGIIQASKANAPAEAFVPIEGLSSDDTLSPLISWYDRNRPSTRITDPAAADFATRLPAGLWNGMIAPVVPYALSGVVWSHGDENMLRAAQYRTLFAALIKSWRKSWGAPAMPFVFVQSPAFGTGSDSPADSQLAELRDAQNSVLALPSTLMEVSLDLFTDPKAAAVDNQTLADRLSKGASFATTAEKIEYMGPVYKSLKVENGAIRIKFDHADSGLAITEGDLLRTFQIAGPDRQWRWADARIEAKDVIVSLHEVPTPVAVRYAWADNWPVAPPPANLANRAGFPAGTFRTDAWPILTDGIVAGGNGYPTEKTRGYAR